MINKDDKLENKSSAQGILTLFKFAIQNKIKNIVDEQKLKKMTIESGAAHSYDDVDKVSSSASHSSVFEDNSSDSLDSDDSNQNKGSSTLAEVKEEED